MIVQGKVFINWQGRDACCRHTASYTLLYAVMITVATYSEAAAPDYSKLLVGYMILHMCTILIPRCALQSTACWQPPLHADMFAKLFETNAFVE